MLGQIKSVLDLLKEVEIRIAELYKECSKVWDDDAPLWDSLAADEMHHADLMSEMWALIEKSPDQYELNRQFKIEGIKLFLSHLDGYIKDVKSHRYSRLQILGITKSLEESIIEKNYPEIVASKNVEFAGIVAEVAVQTMRHRMMIRKRLDDLIESGGRSADNRAVRASAGLVEKKPSEEAVMGVRDEIDPALKIHKTHERMSEYLWLLRRAPQHISQKKAIFEIREIERFIKEDVKNHFKYEEETVFPYVQKDEKANNLIRDLKAQHASVLLEISCFEDYINSLVFPLKDFQVTELNGKIVSFLNQLMIHAKQEDNQLIPLLKK